MAHPEWDLQVLVFVYLSKALPDGSHVWGTDFPEVSGAAQINMWRRGVRRGVSDLHVLSRGIYAALELKSKRGVTSDAQEAFAVGVRRGGGHWFVIRTVEGARGALASVGIICNPAVQVPLEIKIPPKPRTKKARGAFA